MPPKERLSKHGTLSGDDLMDAVAIDINQVMNSTKSPSTRHLFGGAGLLPPVLAQEIERRYLPYWKILDVENLNQDWVGLKKSTNYKGNFSPIELSAGEYKLQLEFPQDLNRNFASSLSRSIVGSLHNLAIGGGEEGLEAKERGLPNMYSNVSMSVRSKKYALLDKQAIMDLGLHTRFTCVFKVLERDLPCALFLKVESFTTLKRLKLMGTLWRRDFEIKREREDRNGITVSSTREQKNLSTEGKYLLQVALNGGGGGGGGGGGSREKKQQPQRQLPNNLVEDDDEEEEEDPNGAAAEFIPPRINPAVDLKKALEKFYKEYAPNKLSDIDRVLDHFQGRINDLIETLEAKYKVRFDYNMNYANL